MRLGPFGVAIYDICMRCAAPRINPLRQRIVSHLTGRVLELGVGTGLNFQFYGSGISVVGIEPDATMLRRARPRAAASRARVRLAVAEGEALPFADAAFDAVIVTLVLCSVASPATTLAELRRVLKPGGMLHFLEHVRSANAAWARFQDLATPACNLLADGCCPNRPTVEWIEQAGFAVQSLDRFSMGIYPTRPGVLGCAARTE